MTCDALDIVLCREHHHKNRRKVDSNLQSFHWFSYHHFHCRTKWINSPTRQTVTPPPASKAPRPSGRQSILTQTPSRSRRQKHHHLHHFVTIQSQSISTTRRQPSMLIAQCGDRLYMEVFCCGPSPSKTPIPPQLFPV